MIQQTGYCENMPFLKQKDILKSVSLIAHSVGLMTKYDLSAMTHPMGCCMFGWMRVFGYRPTPRPIRRVVTGCTSNEHPSSF